MESLSIFGPLSDTALLLGLSLTRIAVAFLLVPLFTAELIPAMVRNALFLGIAVLTLALQPSPAPFVPDTWTLITLFAKEAFIGCAIGFFFAGVMWAFQAAGQIIDTKVGAPALVLLHLVEGVLGLINRFAQQLNVFSLSQSIKAVAAAWIVWIQITVMVGFLQDDLLERGGGIVLGTLRTLFGG